MPYRRFIKEPTLILDEKKCIANIRFMADKAQRNQIELRPHFKTHVSLEIGEWFRECGVDKITVSSLAMAEYFADRWDDITVAFPINILEWERINLLASKIQLNILVENEKAVTFLNQKLTADVFAFVKVDAGNHRTGIDIHNLNSLEKLCKLVEASPKISFKGFLIHAGESYGARGLRQILEIHESYQNKIKKLKHHFINQYPGMMISVGDTPTCSQAEDFTAMDEIRPGNYVFYDVMQWIIGSNVLDKIAVAMACPIVAKHKERNQLVIYGGAVHFARDNRIHPFLDKTIYGLVVDLKEGGWSAPLHKNYYTRMSQEHGVLQVSDEMFDSYEVGDIIGVLPMHSCMTANLMKKYLTLGGKWIDRM